MSVWVLISIYDKELFTISLQSNSFFYFLILFSETFEWMMSDEN